jgi:multimeric flavodoxin WrbA
MRLDSDMPSNRTQGENMKIIGFTASPRKEGNTAWVIGKILEGAKMQGAEIESFYFSDLDIQPCRSCNGCKKGDSGCIIKDDMHNLYDSIDRADAVVLGSPIYMGQMSAQAKIFTDRLYALFLPRLSPYFKEGRKKKKLMLVFTQGNPDSGKFQVYLDYTKSMFQMLEFDVQEVQVVAGMRSEQAHQRQDLYSTMKDVGSSLV